MKSLRFMLYVVLMSLSTVAFAQSDAQKSFDKLKSLAGNWEGPVTTDMPAAMKAKMDANPNPMQVSLRVTSRGNALVHEMTSAGSPGDPITMFYVDGDNLFLTHYCDAGNRPRMTGKVSPDGKTVEFEFTDITGSNQHQHMHHALFTSIDANHHTEDWTFMLGDKPIHAHFDLHRKN